MPFVVGEEVEHLKSYLLIQKNRFGERIQIETQVDECLLKCSTLKLILQPLVENAIVHGLEKKVGGGTIWVSVALKLDRIEFSVRFNGVKTDAEEINRKLLSIEDSHNVFALKNIDTRIKNKYGMTFGITFESHVHMGTRVTETIAYEEKREVETDETFNHG